MNQEEKWEDEFLVHFNYPVDSIYENPKATLKWIGYLAARKIAQEEIYHCKAYYSKDNKIGPIAQLEYAIEKRDRLLDEAKPWMKYLQHNSTTYRSNKEYLELEQWLKQYEEMRGGK